MSAIKNERSAVGYLMMARRRFGDDETKFAVKCPKCGLVQTVQDFIDAGVNTAEVNTSWGHTCLGAYVPGKGCAFSVKDCNNVLTDGIVRIRRGSSAFLRFELAPAPASTKAPALKPVPARSKPPVAGSRPVKTGATTPTPKSQCKFVVIRHRAKVKASLEKAGFPGSTAPQVWKYVREHMEPGTYSVFELVDTKRLVTVENKKLL